MSSVPWRTFYINNNATTALWISREDLFKNLVTQYVLLHNMADTCSFLRAALFYAKHRGGIAAATVIA